MTVMRRIILLLLTAWLLPSLACNLPVTQLKDPMVEQMVRQTLTAQFYQTQMPPPTSTPAAGAASIPSTTPTIPGAPGVELPAQTVTPTGNPGDFHYVTQPGDTLAGLAGRFDVPSEDIARQINGASPQSQLPAGLAITLPDRLGDFLYRGPLLPDSEVIASPATVGFSTQAFVEQANGFLNSYEEEVDGQPLSGAQIVERVATETSTDPRLLLAVLEYRSHWVFGQPSDPSKTAYPIGFEAAQMSGLYAEITLTSRMLTIGYYGWRSGQGNTLTFTDLHTERIDPTLNAGSIALQNLFSKLYTPQQMQNVLYGPNSFVKNYVAWFGDPWQRAAQVEPLLPDDLTQPTLELPFPTGERWTLTGGPHEAWGVGSPWGGLDFAPADVEPGCGVSRFWATAAAPGLVVRSKDGVVALDLDMDGREQTGWVLIYIHLAEKDRVPVGAVVKTGDPLGHPSCEGGVATGINVHISRKYNGEWLPANAIFPFVLSGWQAYPGSRPYRGSLLKGDQVVTSRLDNASTSIIEH